MWHETSVQLGWCTEMHMTVNWWFEGHRIWTRWGSCWFNYRWPQGNLQDPSGDEFHGKPCSLPRGRQPACDGLLWRAPWAIVPRNKDFTPSWPIAFSRRQANGRGGRDGNHSLFESNATMYTYRLMVLVLYDGSIDLLIAAWKPTFLYPDLCHHPASMNVLLVKMNNNRAMSVEYGLCP